MRGKQYLLAMNTISIDSNLYKKAEVYAKLHKISVSEAMERALTLLLGKSRQSEKEKMEESAEFKNALAYVDTLMSKGGTPVPADEDGKGAVARFKYGV